MADPRFLPSSTPVGSDVAPALAGTIHPAALLEDGVRVEPGAVVEARAEIGRGTLISAGATIGEGVAIGRDSFIGANAVIHDALLGNRVRIRPAAVIGGDAHRDPPGRNTSGNSSQRGRVILQDDVEIGEATTVERGDGGDTVVGEGSKIDNQVRIAHNVLIGRHCFVAARGALSDCARLGDFVTVGERGVIGRDRTVGEGARIAAASVVEADVPPGAAWGDMPAPPGVVSGEGNAT